MAHIITGDSKAVFEHATVCPQEAMTGQQEGDLAASSAHYPPGLREYCPPPLLQLCQGDLSSFLGFFSRALLFMVLCGLPRGVPLPASRELGQAVLRGELGQGQRQAAILFFWTLPKFC